MTMSSTAAMLTDEDRRSLDEDGFVILPGLLEVKVVESMLRAITPAVDQIRANDPTWRAGGALHVDLSDDPVFAPVRSSARLFAAVNHLLGPGWSLERIHLRSPQPGRGAQALHGAAALPPAKRHVLDGIVPPIVTAIVALVDFTAENGATRVVAGSHRLWSVRVPASPDAPYAAALPLTCSAGSAIVFSEALLHSGTRNRSTAPRHSLQLSFAPAT